MLNYNFLFKFNGRIFKNLNFKTFKNYQALTFKKALLRNMLKIKHLKYKKNALFKRYILKFIIRSTKINLLKVAFF